MSAFEYFAVIILVAILATTLLYLVYPSTLYRWLVAAIRKFARVTCKTVEVDGITWPYLEGGPKDAEVLLLVHGFSAEKDHWLAYARFFTKRFRVVIPDLPGFGQATRSRELDYGTGAQVSRLDAFLDALGIIDCHVAGNSMGGYILLKLALENPSRVRSLTLMDNAGVKGTNKSELELGVERGENLLKVKSFDDIDRLLAFAMAKPLIVPGRFKQVVFSQMALHVDFWDKLFHGLAREMQDSPLNSQLPEVSVPTLVVWGRQDRLIDVSCVDILREQIPGCESVVFDDVGHMPMVEAPARTARRHLAFLKENSDVQNP
jgi:pimeloyl-ACP methyl ester carboxylesterase